MFFLSELQSGEKIRCAVTYISSSVVYINAGREAGLTVGDTMDVFRHSQPLGMLSITAISKKSSAAQAMDSTKEIAVGDSVISRKTVIIALPRAAQDTKKETTQTAAASLSRFVLMETNSRDENIVSGRAAVQYVSVIADDPRFNLSQPAPMLRLDVRNLYGTGLVFSMYGRSYYDLTNLYQRYGESSRLKTRMYEFVLQYDLPGENFGYGVGRMTSRFVAGMGMFDGGHMYVRSGDFTGGVLFGANNTDMSLNINGDNTKSALFINYHSGKDFLQYYDGTVAYIRQMVTSKLDREFFYLQNNLSLGSELSLYESTELDLNDINNGVRKFGPKLSNTFISVNYYPSSWLNANVGYDGTRSVYLFETMKSFSDTLFDKNMMQGFRANATVRLPYTISLTGGVTYRTKKGDLRDARTLSGTIRTSNILESDVGMGVRYADIIGVYSNGKNITLDIDRTFSYILTAALRYDYYEYTILSQKQSYYTHTMSANINYRISRMFYTSISTDYVIDKTMNSIRLFAEIGIRF